MSMNRHIFLPDMQVKPGVPTDHLEWIGRYIVEKKPNVVVSAGDFADMPSLSSFDRGKKAFEGRRVTEDILAAKRAMRKLLKPLRDYQAGGADELTGTKIRGNVGNTQYNPRLVLLMGNHENRILRACEDSAELDGLLTWKALEYEESGWEVIPFLEVIEIDGILYSHFFPRAPSGRVMQNRRGAPNARLMVQREGQSCTAGHTQGIDMHVQQLLKTHRYGLIAGSCYLHEEGYLSPQGGAHWNGIIVKNEVRNGEYDICLVSLNFLCLKYTGKTLEEYKRTELKDFFGD